MDDAVHPQRDHDRPAVVELDEPGRRDVPRAGRRDDGVERAVAWCAVLAVAGHNGDLVSIAGGLQGGGPPGDLGLDVVIDGDHVPAGAGDLGDDRSVVPGRADLQNPRPFHWLSARRIETQTVLPSPAPSSTTARLPLYSCISPSITVSPRPDSSSALA